MKVFRNNKAVSPVVGVMLMLVATIVLAAVVSSFAGGIAEVSEKAPQLTITTSWEIDDNNITVQHAGGDPVAPNDIRIVLTTYDGTQISVDMNNVTFSEGCYTSWGEYAPFDTGDVITIPTSGAIYVNPATGNNANFGGVGYKYKVELFVKGQSAPIATAYGYITE